MIQRGNGHTGEAHGLAANLAKAKRILWPAAQEPPTPHRTGAGAEPPSRRHRTAPRPTNDGLRQKPAPSGRRSGVGVHDLARQAPIAR
ncbi:hypothetical protein [Streptomyces sp. 021-3]|uniref:hypothetical protein n=1 Tax=Streptomyces sp. 021-3 TaxID=2789259 RepID=UPI0039819060